MERRRLSGGFGKRSACIHAVLPAWKKQQGRHDQRSECPNGWRDVFDHHETKNVISAPTSANAEGLT
jgi:hypothetical protein